MPLRARTAPARGLLLLTLLTSAFASGCDAVGGSDPAVLTGQVVNAASNRPLAEGTSITVTVEGENVEAKGGVAVSLQDRIAPGARSTQFQFSVRAVDPALPASIDEIKIDVASPNGTATGKRPGSRRPGAAVAGRAPVVAARR